MNEDNAKEYLLSRNPTLVNTFLINKWPIDCSRLSGTCVSIAETDSGLSDLAVQFWGRFIPLSLANIHLILIVVIICQYGIISFALKSVVLDRLLK